jgi:hypothetical protein
MWLVDIAENELNDLIGEDDGAEEVDNGINNILNYLKITQCTIKYIQYHHYLIIKFNYFI